MNYKIIYIPLDDRPCNTQFVEALGEIGGFDIIMPPKETLGKFDKKGNRTYIREWLLSQKGDALIVSIDMLCYGGLMASRTIDIDIKEAKFFLETLREYKSLNSNIPIYAFNNIMRISISILGKESYSWWKKINKYNELKYKVDLLNENKYEEALIEIQSEIPQNILDTYIKVRERNHEINMMSLNYLKDGIIDLLILSQEDCSEFGLHLIEQRQLEKIIDKNKLQDSVFLYPGADEIGQVLLTRVFNDINSFCPKVSIVYDNDENSRLIPKFEDIPIKNNIYKHIESFGGKVENDISKADFILAVSTPNLPYLDHMEDENGVYDKKEIIDDFVEKIKKIDNKFVALCDLSYSNGGDVYLVEKLLQSNSFFNLCTYSGWNTAGNSLGTALAHGNIISYLSNNNKLDKGNLYLSIRFLIERLCDDLFYQGIIRKKVIQELLTKNLDPYNIGETYEEINVLITNNIRKYIKKIDFNRSIKYGNKYEVEIKDINISSYLPWNRAFEVECIVEYNMEFA